MSIKNILEMDVFELIEYINHDFYVTLPENIISIEDMQDASKMLAKLINSYTFLSNMAEYTKILVRQNKGKIEKDELNMLIGKRDVLVQAVDTVKMQYSALSRMITVKQEINNELKMSDVRY